MTSPTPDNSADAIRTAIVRALRQVHDPEIPINIYDLGLIYDLDVDESGPVKVTMTLTSPNCPVAEAIPASVKEAIRGVDGVTEVAVDLVWEPAWTPERMSEAARLELEFTGHTGPAHLRKSPGTSLTVGRTERQNRDRDRRDRRR